MQDIIARMNEVRGRTLELITPLSDHDLHRQHDRLMSPIAWDLGHIGNFEELWGMRQLPGSEEVYPQLDEIYDAVRNPRSTRADLDLPSREDLLRYLTTIRSSVIRKRTELQGNDDPLLREDYVYHMLLQHEVQHQETILQTLQLKQGDLYPLPAEGRTLPDGSSDGVGTFVTIPGGEMEFGTDQRSGVYDNERPAHRRSVSSFRMGRFPVTNGEYLRFVEDGGYRRKELFDEEGWRFLRDEKIEAPKYWIRDSDGWSERVMERVEPLNPLKPVCHVCWHEATAYARYLGARLPSEIEWEYAARFDPETGLPRRNPWGEDEWHEGLANLGIDGWGRAEIGAFPAGASPFGVEQMIGEVWEWTSSHFEAWPGFEAYPYDEYSRVFFGDKFRVLRGGSWATDAAAIRGTFRNWDFPIRRQIFAGFRLADDL